MENKLNVGDILRNKKTNNLHQVTKLTSASIFIKKIGSMLHAEIRYTEYKDIENNFNLI